MIKSLLLTTAAAICLSVGLPSLAHAETKVGTVNMDKIFKGYYKTQDAEKKINEAREAAKKELDERMEGYKKNIDAINKLNEDLESKALSNDAKAGKAKDRDAKIAETRNMERDINEFRTQREKQLQDQMGRMRKTIVDEIVKIILEKVKAENYDIVFDRSGISANGVEVLIFARENYDFSDTVLTDLNKSKPAN